MTDFEALTTTSMRWGKSWQRHIDAERFVTAVCGDVAKPSTEWAMAYWLGDDDVEDIDVTVGKAAAFLKDRGEDYELVYDTREINPSGEMWGYVILTNYVTLTWADHMEGDELPADPGYRED